MWFSNISAFLSVLIVSKINFCEAKTFTDCELARRLDDFGMSNIGDWVCLAKWESGSNTNALECDDGTCDYGIFQISSKFWCRGEGSVSNECGFTCSSILGSYVSQTEINCVRKIQDRHGFKAWQGWKDNCRGKDVKSYIRGCGV